MSTSERTTAARMATDPVALEAGRSVAALFDVLGASDRRNLDARQLEAAELRDEFLGKWRDTIAEIIDRGTYLDREDVDGLVDAALPGVDEIFGVLRISQLAQGNLANHVSTKKKGRGAKLVIDMAPTGHALELLRMPERIATWSRLLLKMLAQHRTLALAQDVAVEIARQAAFAIAGEGAVDVLAFLHQRHLSPGRIPRALEEDAGRQIARFRTLVPRRAGERGEGMRADRRVCGDPPEHRPRALRIESRPR